MNTQLHTMTDIPDELPTYVEDTISNHADDPEVLAAIRDYATALHAAADEDSPTPDEIAASRDGEVERFRPGGDGWYYVQRKVKCGDDTCHCATGEKHGPYWYKVRRDDAGDVKWEYVGKKIDPDDAPADGADPEASA